MSSYMLSDQDTIDDINPFVVRDFSLPGGVRQTPDFADHAKDVHGKKDIEYTRLSPICDVAKTSGDRTVDFCTGGRQPGCPLRTPLHPRRNIDYGFTRDARMKIAAAAENDRNGWLITRATVALLLIILLVWVLRR